jgi:hypothetical protein
MANPFIQQTEPGNQGRMQSNKGAAGLHKNILAQTQKHRAGNLLMGKKNPFAKKTAAPPAAGQKGVNPFAKGPM